MGNSKTAEVEILTMKLFKRLCCLAFLFLFLACNNDITGPSSKDPRHLKWTTDTLSYPGNYQTLLGDIWGSAPDDVYAVGHSSTTEGVMWHFDGERWSNVRISGSQGGPISGSITFSDIFGFSSKDVWAVGKRNHTNPNPPPNSLFTSLLIHNDSNLWQDIPTPEGSILTAVWGRSSDDLWIGGINGTLFYYDGVTVAKDSIPLDIPKDADPFFNVLSLTGSPSGEVYMLLADFGGNRYFFLENKGSGWIVTDSTFFYDSSRLWMSPSNTLYVSGQSVYKRQGQEWVEMLEGRSTLYSSGITGTSDDNIIVVGSSSTGNYPGAAYHFDGTDWSEITELRIQNNNYFDVWTDGTDIFVIGRADGKTIVRHGK